MPSFGLTTMIEAIHWAGLIIEGKKFLWLQ